MANEIVMTKEGYDDLVKELNELKTTRRAEISEKIRVARGFGDLSENSEYDEAKNEQAQVEARIAQIEGMLKIARVIDDAAIDTDTVSIGTRVKILDIEFDDEDEYSIVGSSEADPSQNRLSYESPVGKALLGKKVGDCFTVFVNDNYSYDAVIRSTIQFKILDISR